MQIRVKLKNGLITHEFTCKKEFGATIRRYLLDRAALMTVKL
ncbi:hypothetical protein IGI53_001520 [Enterococcus sp. DIV0788_1]